MSVYKTSDKERERLRIKSKQIYYSRVDLGDQAKLWNKLKADMNVKTHAAMADYLMTMYEKVLSSGVAPTTAASTSNGLPLPSLNRRCRKPPKKRLTKQCAEVQDSSRIEPLSLHTQRRNRHSSSSSSEEDAASGERTVETEGISGQNFQHFHEPMKSTERMTEKDEWICDTERVVGKDKGIRDTAKRRKKSNGSWGSETKSFKPGESDKDNTDVDSGDDIDDDDTTDDELDEVDQGELEDIEVEKSPVYKHHVIVAVSTDGRLRCEDCQLTFKRWSQAEEHTGSWFRYTCDGCGRLFGKGTNFGKHRSTHLTGDEPSDGDVSNSKICDVCSATFLYDKSLEAHMKMAHGLELKLPVRNQHVCLLCGMAVSGMRSLGTHVTSHYRKEAGVKCRSEGCRLLFATEREAEDHLRACHRQREKSERVLCQECGMFFHNKRQVRRHVEEWHVRLRKFPCDWPGCHKAFLEKRHLKNHLMIHTDEKPLKCEFCDYCCRQRTSMNWHLKKHGILKKSVERKDPNDSSAANPLNRFFPTRGRKSMKKIINLENEEYPGVSSLEDVSVLLQNRMETVPTQNIHLPPPGLDQGIVHSRQESSASVAKASDSSLQPSRCLEQSGIVQDAHTAPLALPLPHSAYAVHDRAPTSTHRDTAYKAAFHNFPSAPPTQSLGYALPSQRPTPTSPPRNSECALTSRIVAHALPGLHSAYPMSCDGSVPGMSSHGPWCRSSLQEGRPSELPGGSLFQASGMNGALHRLAPSTLPYPTTCNQPFGPMSQTSMLMTSSSVPAQLPGLQTSGCQQSSGGAGYLTLPGRTYDYQTLEPREPSSSLAAPLSVMSLMNPQRLSSTLTPGSKPASSVLETDRKIHPPADRDSNSVEEMNSREEICERNCEPGSPKLGSGQEVEEREELDENDSCDDEGEEDPNIEARPGSSSAPSEGNVDEKQDESSHHILFATTEGKVRCEACDMIFDSWREAEEHTGQRSFIRYTCDSCRRLFSSPWPFIWHRLSHLEGNETSATDEDPRLKKCPECAASFLCDRLLLNHMKVLHRLPVKPLAKKEFVCLVCGESVSGIKNFGTHVSAHFRTSKEVKCPRSSCDRYFATKAEANHHNKSVHRKEVEAQRSAVLCQLCGMMYSWRSIRNHVSSVHTRHRKFVCDWLGCGKAFLERKHLKKHKMIHTDERPLKCQFCDYSCRQRNSMNWHLKKHGIFKTSAPSDGQARKSTGLTPRRGRKSLRAAK